MADRWLTRWRWRNSIWTANDIWDFRASMLRAFENQRVRFPYWYGKGFTA